VGPPGAVAAVRTLLAAAVHGRADLSVSPAHRLFHPVAGHPASGGNSSHCPRSPWSAEPPPAAWPPRLLAACSFRHRPARAIRPTHTPCRASRLASGPAAAPRISQLACAWYGRIPARSRSSTWPRPQLPHSGVDHGFPGPPEDIDGQQFSPQIITARPTRNPIKARNWGNALVNHENEVVNLRL
jgi:hypothetical protein